MIPTTIKKKTCPAAVTKASLLLSVLLLFSASTDAQSIAQTPEGWNCESLNDDYQVRWKIDNNNIDVELLALDLPDGSYMSFGISGSATSTNMVGADVVVAVSCHCDFVGSAIRNEP